ncbi:MAG: spermidine/putrescine ABC transporter ATP-binding protein [Actinobacteria bacterium 69-20]|nr:ABC transporter ATP-binding protein [Actinomycetota bacterium]OJV29542.1 MAG: spermidine/putrescine ABC transporter ATP-binding protein [Actinobacteria bacterium 69-20]
MDTAGVGTVAGVAPVHGVLVELNDLRRSFGTVRALDGMDLTINPGELVVLLGPSGCGKTTALRVLAGLEDADSGRITVDGRDISSVPTSKRDMGMVFQAYSLFPHMTALQNVEFGLTLRGKGSAERRRIAGNYLELVGLSEQAGRYARQLSGGQQQRVALARALAIEPKVLLLDEPLSALDAKVRVQLRDEIRRIQLELGITTLFVTHDQEEALAVADRVGVMWEGRIQQIASPAELYTAPVNKFVAEFVGLSNPLPGTASEGAATVLGQRVPLLPGSPPSGSVTVLVRPEAVTLVPGPDSAAGSDVRPGSVTGTIVGTSFLGSTGRAQVRLADGTLIIAQIASADVAVLRVGETVDVRLEQVPALAVASMASRGSL